MICQAITDKKTGPSCTFNQVLKSLLTLIDTASSRVWTTPMRHNPEMQLLLNGVIRKCLSEYTGGEAFFNNLDGQLRDARLTDLSRLGRSQIVQDISMGRNQPLLSNQKLSTLIDQPYY